MNQHSGSGSGSGSGRAADPFLLNYQPADLEIASEFFSNWLPFLSRDLCRHCTTVLSDRISSLKPVKTGNEPVNSDEKSNASTQNNFELEEEINDYHDGNCDGNSLGSWKDGATGSSEPVLEASTSELTSGSLETPSPRMSWADMAQEDELEEEDDYDEESDNKQLDDYDEESDNKQLVNINNGTGGLRISKVIEKPKLSRDQREYIRFMYIKRKKDFICLERYKGKLVNIVEGLELHTGIFSAVEQKRIVDHVYMLEEKGKRGELKERTYTAPQKWMRGKGRVTIQFGCCYNYAVDKNGNPPGILHNEMVDPLPDLFKVIIRRLIRWHVLPPTCVPDSCIVNIYDEGDCIPPHIDSHDFVRPFCTVSFLSECKILFGSNLKITGPGDFSGLYAIPLPVGSVLVLNGNGADLAKHCVPAVPTKRISITFRRMDESKRPNGNIPEPDLQGIQPLSYDVEKNKRINSPKAERYTKRQPIRRASNTETWGSSGRNYFHSEAPESTWSRRGAGNRRNRRVYVGN